MSSMDALEWHVFQSSLLLSTLTHDCGWGENRSRADNPESPVRPRKTFKTTPLVVKAESQTHSENEGKASVCL